MLNYFLVGFGQTYFKARTFRGIKSPRYFNFAVFFFFKNEFRGIVNFVVEPNYYISRSDQNTIICDISISGILVKAIT